MSDFLRNGGSRLTLGRVLFNGDPSISCVPAACCEYVVKRFGAEKFSALIGLSIGMGFTGGKVHDLTNKLELGECPLREDGSGVLVAKRSAAKGPGASS